MAGEIEQSGALILPFLPRRLAQWYRSHPGEIHHWTRHDGVLVCLDASGFTRLTAKLEAGGEDGPEILTHVLNAFFSVVIDVADRFDADVLKFSGDGLWLYLPDPHAVIALAEAIQSSLRDVNGRHDYLKSDPISVHLGAELGSFELVSFGDAKHRLEAEPIGKVVSEAYACCDRAVAGEIVVGPELTRFQAAGTPTPFPSAEQQSTAISANPTRPNQVALSEAELACKESVLWRYVPQALIGRMAGDAGSSRMNSEYREIAVLFCECAWEDQLTAGDIDVVRNRVGQVLQLVRKFGGSLARIDPFKDGHKLLILFGAPVKRSDDHWRALECARQISLLNQADFQVRVGAACGRTFCGAVGSHTRREYTIMGSAANLAARLMAKADWGKVLLNDTMRALLPTSVISRPQELSVKGFVEPITVHRLEYIDELIVESASDTQREMFLHTSYQRAFDRLNTAVSENRRQAVIVCGSHGTGKSLVLRSCLTGSKNRLRIMLDARQAIFFKPGYVARKLLSELAALNPEAAAIGLGQWVQTRFAGEPLAALSGVLDGSLENDAWTKDLTPQLRQSMADKLFTDIVRGLISDHVIVAIDDLDGADAYSRQLILVLCSLGSELDATILATTSDLTVINGSAGTTAFDSSELCSPSKAEWRQYFSAHLSNGRREEDLADRLIEQSDGLPRTVFEFLSQRMTSGDLVANPVTSRWELRQAATEITVPRSARDLNLETFDALPEGLRSVLKLCAIAATEFDAALIAEVSGELAAPYVDSCLNELCLRGILRPNEAEHAYRFESQSLKEAIHSCIPRADLMAWHLRSARRLEAHDPAQVELLAYHYAGARQTVKGYSYSLTAARTALSMYALGDAAHHFENCQSLMGAEGAALIPPKQVVAFHREFARFLVLEGRVTEAYRTFRTWRRLAEGLADSASALASVLGTAELLWQQSKYGRCERVLRAALDQIPLQESPELVAKGMTLLAEVARRTGRFADAEAWARQALAKSDDPSACADAYNRLGLALWALGKLPDAVTCLQKSLSGDQREASMYNRARLANNLAIVHWQMGALVQAEPLMREAIDIFRRQGDRRNEAYARGNFAALIREFGKHADAANMLAEADIIFERLGDRHAHYYTVGNLGDIDLVSGDLDRARSRFNEALAFAESVSDGDLQAECKVRLGEVAFLFR